MVSTTTLHWGEMVSFFTSTLIGFIVVADWVTHACVFALMVRKTSLSPCSLFACRVNDRWWMDWPWQSNWETLQQSPNGITSSPALLNPRFALLLHPQDLHIFSYNWINPSPTFLWLRILLPFLSSSPSFCCHSPLYLFMWDQLGDALGLSHVENPPYWPTILCLP